MEAFKEFISFTNGLVWGADNIPYPPVLLLLLGTGLFLTIRLGFMPIRKIPYAIGQLFNKSHDKDEGDVTPFGALMTALSSTIGTGNIAGVAVAIAIGGPGAVFWMWMTALVGMASKYAEAVLAVQFREVDGAGRHVGGPMYYIKNGMGPKWAWLGFVFAGFAILASWGTGASIQANAIADAVRSNYGIAPWITGLALAAGAGAVILGGITRIAAVAEKLVPAMAIAYLAAGLICVAINIEGVPNAFSQIFGQAFGFKQGVTGVSVGLILLAMQKGVARGIFSNEAGQGSAPIAHAAARNNDPVNQGIVAMLGTFIDTIVVCTITALVILTANIIPQACEPFVRESLILLPEGCETSSPLTVAAFEEALPGIGNHIVAIGLVVFGFTTILGWSYYGERCAEFLFGEKSILPFKISWIVVVFGGAVILMLERNESITDIVSLFWLVADTLTGLMAAPNLIALLVLSPLIATMTKKYFDRSDTPDA
ncbi:MAG: sodium:alanine symporter family protein [Ponticaulis sp.]|nr:sodium:alanine symporter family protein [Ponticaulis sp.]|tara:strand:+ start:8599 stop:10050 length:1452 start_codon:yes stop_codon:yes gene_type:complete